jgi:hypothetical protein
VVCALLVPLVELVPCEVVGIVKLGTLVASALATAARLVAAGGVYCTTDEDIAAREEVASASLDACTLIVVVV